MHIEVYIARTMNVKRSDRFLLPTQEPSSSFGRFNQSELVRSGPNVDAEPRVRTSKRTLIKR